MFFSYSHADEGMRDQLEKHLSALKNQGLIEAWHDRRILAGQNFDSEIDSHLESASIILLLVSPDFLASEYCYNEEMRRALELSKSGSAAVIPVILRPCDWHDTPFGNLLAAPKDGFAITQWTNVDEAFLDVVKAIKTRLPRVTEAGEGSHTNPAGTTQTAVIRSSNLRVTKNFNQLDKDRFLHAGFDYLAKFFENSLKELTDRNPGIEHSFRRIDANRFTATAYRNGEKKCQCSVYLGGFPNAISYAMGEDARGTGFNESISVENDDQLLYFKCLGMQSFGRTSDKLAPQGQPSFTGVFLFNLSSRTTPQQEVQSPFEPSSKLPVRLWRSPPSPIFPLLSQYLHSDQCGRSPRSLFLIQTHETLVSTQTPDQI